MKRNGGLWRRAHVVGILTALICLVMVGTVAAVDNDMMDNCRQLAAGNGTTGYWPGMMGGAGMMDAGLMTGGSILIVLFFVVWLIVGILLIIWLIKQLQTDKKQP